MKKRTLKVVVLALLVVLVLGVAGSALAAEEKNAFKFESGNKKDLNGSYSFTLETKAADLTVEAEIAGLTGSDPNDTTVNITPQKLGDQKTLKKSGTLSWSFTNVAKGAQKVTVVSNEAVTDVLWRVKASGSYQIEMTDTKITLAKGKSKTLTTEYAGGLSKTWTSSDPNVATVDGNGKVTAKAQGTATITCNAGGQAVTCKVTVSNISSTEETIYTKNSVTLKVVGASGTVTWSSSNTGVATVDSKGKVTGVKAGTATITATVGSDTYTCKVTVKTNPYPKAMQVKNGPLALRKSPSRTAAKVGKGFYPNGTKVTALSDAGNGWVKVKVSDGETGYMMVQYLGGAAGGTGGTGGTGTDTPPEGTGAWINMQTTSALRLRKWPDTKHGTYRSYAKGTKVKARKVNSQWYEVKVNKDGATGYMMAKYLKEATAAGSGTGTGTQTLPQASSFKKMVVSNSSNVRLRKGPGTNYGSYQFLKKGTVVEAGPVNGTWHQVKWNGKVGYMMSRYLTDKK